MKQARYKIATSQGDQFVTGFIVGAFGIDKRDHKFEVWTITHLATGRRFGKIGADFKTVEDRLSLMQEKLELPWNDRDLKAKIDTDTNKKIFKILNGGSIR